MSGGVGLARFISGQLRIFRFSGHGSALPMLFESKNEYDDVVGTNVNDSLYRDSNEIDGLIDAEFATNYYEEGIRWTGMASLSKRLIPAEYLDPEENLNSEGLPDWWVDPNSLYNPVESDTDLTYARGKLDALSGVDNRKDYSPGSEKMEAYLDGLSEGTPK